MEGEDGQLVEGAAVARVHVARLKETTFMVKSCGIQCVKSSPCLLVVLSRDAVVARLLDGLLVAGEVAEAEQALLGGNEGAHGQFVLRGACLQYVVERLQVELVGLAEVEDLLIECRKSEKAFPIW